MSYNHLRTNPPGVSSVDGVEIVFAVFMRTAEQVIPSQEQRIPGRRWRGDAQTEAELWLRLMRCTQPGSAENDH